MKAVQREREEKLAVKLKEMLDEYVHGNRRWFLQHAESKAKVLSEAAFGVEMLNTIGYVYLRKAAQELGKKAFFLGMPFVVEWVRTKGHLWRSQMTTAKGATQLLQLQDDMHRQLRMNAINTGNDVESHIWMNKETLIHSLWRLNVVDIEVTLMHVYHLVLRESSAGKEELKARAKALRILGKAFQNQRLGRRAGTSRKKYDQDVEDAYSSSESDTSDEQELPRALFPALPSSPRYIIAWNRQTIQMPLQPCVGCGRRRHCMQKEVIRLREKYHPSNTAAQNVCRSYTSACAGRLVSS